MQATIAFTLALAAPAAISGSAVQSSDASFLGENPVTKVNDLIKQMLANMEKEQEDDEKAYNKMACWCETNEREKTKAIKNAEAHIEALTTQIEELTQLSAQLNTEIKNTKAEVANNQQGLDKATAIRQKQLADFNAEEKDMLQSIASLKQALTVLSKHASFLQMPPNGETAQVDAASMSAVASTLNQLLAQHAPLFKGALTGSERQAAMAFIQQKSGAPQSGEVIGILESMKETFDTNLAALQKEEADNVKAYEELKSAKELEVVAGQDQVGTKTQELADTDEKNANSKLDLDDTKKQLNADEVFVADMTEKCQTADREWDTRQKERQQEIQACSKALAILSSDEVHNLFTSTFSFTQTKEGISQSRERQQASKLVSEFATKHRSPMMAALAVRMKLDSFTKVKKAIDDMVASLLKEKEDEIKQKDFCIEEFNTNEVQTTDKTRAHSDLVAKIEDLSQTITELTETLDTLNAEVSEMQLQRKHAGEDREMANMEFQMIIKNQRASQAVLTKAMDVLKEEYEKGASFVQLRQPTMTKFDKQDGGGVIGMIQKIIDDAKSMETEAIRDEEDSQKAYEDFVKETNTGIDLRKDQIVQKTTEKATAEADKIQAEEDRDNTMLELEMLANYNGQLHKSCDFVLKNFEVRQTARDEEVGALRTAKDILSGAKFVQYLRR